MGLNAIHPSELAQRSDQVRQDLLRYLSEGGEVAVIQAPPGSGKTHLLLEAVAWAVSKKMRVAVATQTNAQADDICRRLARDHSRVRCTRYVGKGSKGAEVPDSVLVTADSSALPPNSSVVVGTAAKWGLVQVESPFDLIFVEEAWQLKWADFMLLDQVSARFVLIGDPGQIPPVVTVETARWETSYRPPHQPAPEVILADPRIPALRGERSVKAGGVSRSAADKAIDLLRESTAVALTLPTPPGGPPMERDDELAGTCVELVRRLLSRESTCFIDGKKEPLTADEIGLCATHHSMNAALELALPAGVREKVRVDTAECWQGLQKKVMVIVHPLSGVIEPSAFDLENGAPVRDGLTPPRRPTGREPRSPGRNSREVSTRSGAGAGAAGCRGQRSLEEPRVLGCPAGVGDDSRSLTPRRSNNLRLGEMTRELPSLVAHADWSMHSSKRWMAIGRRVGSSYELGAPETVGDVASLLSRLRLRADANGPIVIGFDFPLGVPIAYARRAGISRFRDALPQLGAGDWSQFYEVARVPNEISTERPFYPFRPGGTRQKHLLSALGVDSMLDLLRTCDRGYPASGHSQPGRGNACAMFWTLGGKQVGKGTIAGWRDVIGPALRRSDIKAAIWPFDGHLDELLRTSNCVLVETYPAEACTHLGLTAPGTGWSKQKQLDRRTKGIDLLSWARRRGVSVAVALEAAILDGITEKKSGEDPFDAVVGLMSMTEILLGHRQAGEPTQDHVREIEGWIFGQTPSPDLCLVGPRQA